MSGVLDAKKLVMYRFGLLILLSVAVYATTLSHGFVWDDNFIIVNNPLLEKPGNIAKIFLAEDTVIGSTGYYRPVTYISFALDRAIWGLNPTGFHVTNLILQILAVVLFHAVIAALFRNERLAFVAALVFALHPLAGETVNFLAGGRNTLLSACFALLSLLFYIKRRYIPAVASFTAAIFSKEFALLLPLIFLWYDCRLQREKICVSRYITFLVPVVGYLTLRSFAVQKANFFHSINVSDTLTAPYLVVRYIINMTFPFHLKIMYDLKPDPLTIILSLLAVAGMAGVVYHFRNQDEILFSAFWVLLFLLPVINIIPLESASLMADRYAYFSLMGFSLCLATIICRVDGRAVTVGVVALCTAYSFIDFSRNSIWKNEIEFFTRMTRDAPEKFDGFQNLGMYYYKKGDIARALPQLTVALSKSNITAGFLIGSASVFWKENRLVEAETSLLRAMALDPANPEPYLMLITIYERNGNVGQAASYREKAEGLFHGIERRMVNRTVELCREGERYLSRQLYIPAENVFWQSLMSDPDHVPALIGMGRLATIRGDFANAERYFRRALAVDPLNAAGHYNLSIVYRNEGRASEAENELKKFREAEARAGEQGSVPRE